MYLKSMMINGFASELKVSYRDAVAVAVLLKEMEPEFDNMSDDEFWTQLCGKLDVDRGELVEKYRELMDGIALKQKGRRRRGFTKPTIDEVRAYCIERKNHVDPQAFVDFYDAKGWVVGRTPMKDWKAAIRTWERRHGTVGVNAYDRPQRHEPQPNFYSPD